LKNYRSVGKAEQVKCLAGAGAGHFSCGDLVKQILS